MNKDLEYLNWKHIYRSTKLYNVKGIFAKHTPTLLVKEQALPMAD